MNAIIAQIISDAIDAEKIPDLDYIDMERRADGQFSIVLNDGHCILVTTEFVTLPGAAFVRETLKDG